MSVLTDKVEKGIPLTEYELRELLWEDEDVSQVESVELEELRWHRVIQTIILINGQTWAVDWRRGLTEIQEDEFYDQPYKVKQKKRVITVVDWVEVEE